MDGMHPCPIRGCSRLVDDRFLMCRPHWALVPDGIKKAVWRNLRDGQQRDAHPTRNYCAARKAAVDFVEKTVEQTEPKRKDG